MLLSSYFADFCHYLIHRFYFLPRNRSNFPTILFSQAQSLSPASIRANRVRLPHIQRCGGTEGHLQLLPQLHEGYAADLEALSSGQVMNKCCEIDT
jgi:hypothetical protein